MSVVLIVSIIHIITLLSAVLIEEAQAIPSTHSVHRGDEILETHCIIEPANLNKNHVTS